MRRCSSLATRRSCSSRARAPRMPHVFGPQPGRVSESSVDQQRSAQSRLAPVAGFRERRPRNHATRAVNAASRWRSMRLPASRSAPRHGGRPGGCALKVSRRLAVVVALRDRVRRSRPPRTRSSGRAVGGRTVTLAWRQFPIRYFVTNRDVDGVTAQQLPDRGAARVSTPGTAVPNTPDRRRSSSASRRRARPPATARHVLGFQNRSGPRSRARGDQLLHRHARRARSSSRTSSSIPSFTWSDIGCRRLGRASTSSPSRCTRSAICSASSHSALGETELRAGGRRVLGAEAVMFPIAFSAGRHQRSARSRPTILPASRTSTATRRSSARPAASAGRSRRTARACLAPHVVAFNPASGKAGRRRSR